jgi:5,5'-dehydrodivanillate O-demethylase
LEQGDTNARKVEQAKLFGETSADSLMGKLLRRFWHPVARVETLPKGRARAIRILGEDLTLYRGESGEFHLVGARCAHRGTVLQTAWVEGEELRCMYHGWRYDGTGLCTEIPAERQARARMPRIAGYPTRSYAGLVFAYMGELPVPEFDLPRKDAFEDPARHIVALEQVWDCNWFQQVENSLDPLHIRFAHRWGKQTHYGDGRMMSATPELSYSETASGVRQSATTEAKGRPRISDWIFPNNNHLTVPGAVKGDPWTELCAWTVPVDDVTTIRFRAYSFPASCGPQARAVAEGDPTYNPADHREALFDTEDPAHHKAMDVADLQFFTAQDYVAMRGQGVVADRVNENLSVSDAGVLFLRRLFLREMEAIRLGKPTKQWTRPDEEVELPPQEAEAAK